MKNAFCFTSKLFSFSRFLCSCLDCLVMQQNDLIRKKRFISNFMTSQPGKQTIAIHILFNILRSEGNQTLNFGQLELFLKKKVLQLVSLLYFVYNFWRKIFLLSCFINWPNFIAWLPLLCEILAIWVLQMFVNQGVMSSCITKGPLQKLKYLENEKSF